jgi:hypothetical protein
VPFPQAIQPMTPAANRASAARLHCSKVVIGSALSVPLLCTNRSQRGQTNERAG